MPPFMPRSNNEIRRDRHRRPNRDQASIGTPMTSPGECCGACDWASSRSVGVDFGASSDFGAGVRRACSAESASTKAAEAIAGIRISSSPRRLCIRPFRGNRSFRRTDASGGPAALWPDFGDPGVAGRVMSRGGVKKIGGAPNSCALVDCRRWPLSWDRSSSVCQSYCAASFTSASARNCGSTTTPRSDRVGNTPTDTWSLVIPGIQFDTKSLRRMALG